MYTNTLKMSADIREMCPDAPTIFADNEEMANGIKVMPTNRTEMFVQSRSTTEKKIVDTRKLSADTENVSLMSLGISSSPAKYPQN